jgi:hypothetical protein
VVLREFLLPVDQGMTEVHTTEDSNFSLPSPDRANASNLLTATPTTCGMNNSSAGAPSSFSRISGTSSTPATINLAAVEHCYSAGDLPSRKKRKRPSSPKRSAAGEGSVGAVEMVNEKRSFNKTHTLALIDAAKQEAMYWRFRKEALALELRRKNLPVPDMDMVDMSDSPLLSGALEQEVMSTDINLERRVSLTVFWHFLLIWVLKLKNMFSAGT